MRPFEILCLILCVLGILALGTQHPKLQKIILVMCLFSLGLHLVQEGWRWQMIPAYLLIIVLSFFIFREANFSVSAVSSTLVILAVLSLPLFMLPIPSHPELTGEYSVGTFSLDITDTTTKRILPTKLWFPINKPNISKTAKLQNAAWLDNYKKTGPVIAKIAAMPGFIFNHLRYFKSAYRADISQALINDKPLIVLSHGRGGFKEMNSFMAMEFASKGYTVIAPDHAKGALLTVLADGTEIPFDPKEFAEGENLPDAEYDVRIRELGQRWVQDLITVTDYVQNKFPGLTGKKVISGGHSTGGGTAIEFCNNDSRCIGAIGLDAWMLPIAEGTLSKIHKPLLSFFGDSRLKYFEPINRKRFERLQEASKNTNTLNKEFVIAKANHLDFCDAALLSPYSYLLGQDKGRINTHTVMNIINQHALNFAKALSEGKNLNNIQWQRFSEEMDWVNLE